MLDTLIGTRIAHVPYRGAGPAMQDMIAGRIDYSCEQISTAFPQIEAGAVKAIATLGPTRPPVLARVPTAQEQGLPGLDCNAWIALVFPKGTSAVAVQRLAKATRPLIHLPCASDSKASAAPRGRRGDAAPRTPPHSSPPPSPKSPPPSQRVADPLVDRAH